MEFGLTQQQKELQAEVRSFVLREQNPALIEEVEWENVWGPAVRAFMRKIGERGWMVPTWPREYGGIESSNMEKLIIAEEMTYHRVRTHTRGAGMAGPTILHFGTDDQKKEWLPRIARGEIEFALGYTEPQAGSDLGALDIRAVEDGDFFVITGLKTFNSACHHADYHWLGARTDPDKPKHRGVSLFIVDMKSPGITVRALETMGGVRTNEVFYDHVRVPKQNLVGTRGQGFYQIAVALDFERMMPVGPARRLFNDIVAYAKASTSNRRKLSEDPMVRRQLAELSAEVDVCQLLAFRVAWMLDQKRSPNYEASMLKVFLTETLQRLGHIGFNILGPFGQLARGSRRVPINGDVEHHHRIGPIESIWGGTSEIQRNIIAQRGLGLPRP